jgi:uncharacterized membrane protein
MKQKTYKTFSMFMAMVLAAICSISVVQGNYILPIFAAITAALVMFAAKKQVEGVLADERDYQNAGNAARWALNIYVMTAAITSIVLMGMRAANPVFELLAQVFAYSACSLMISQSLLFKYFQTKK